MDQSPAADRVRITSITLRPGLLRRLDEYAQQRNVTRSAAVSLAVSELLMREKREATTT